MKEDQRHERWTERHDQLCARIVQVEQAFRTIARTVLQNILGSKTSIALSLRELLEELNLKRESPWEDVLDQMIEQKAKGSPQDNLKNAERTTSKHLHELTQVIKELSGRQLRRGSFPRLFSLGESLQSTQASAEAHFWRGWNRVALRSKLAPEIFNYEARSYLLIWELDVIFRTAQQIQDSS